jgi:hypothetical protein
MDDEMIDLILTSGPAALATSGPHGLNVVPVSVVSVCEGEIRLYDFFMEKTAENIKADPQIALTCWRGKAGLQVKGEAKYDTEGTVYEEAVIEMKERFPERELTAVIRLKPSEIFDVSPKNRKKT